MRTGLGSGAVCKKNNRNYYSSSIHISDIYKITVEFDNIKNANFHEICSAGIFLGFSGRCFCAYRDFCHK